MTFSRSVTLSRLRFSSVSPLTAVMAIGVFCSSVGSVRRSAVTTISSISNEGPLEGSLAAKAGTDDRANTPAHTGRESLKDIMNL